VSPLVFVVLAFLTVVAALTVVVHKNPVHSACALVVTLFLLSIFFVGLDAQLVAALQVIVYAGAIVVLFLFVIMLLNLQAEVRDVSARALIATGAAGAVALAVLLIAALRRDPSAAAKGVTEGYGETAALAERLFTVYLVPFELTSILLLVAIVGAVALAKKGN
jgi:NADH-quinone oxidoreductase subunit J